MSEKLYTPDQILNVIIKPCLELAQETIPFFEVGPDINSIILYGAPGAILDSLNLVTFVFQLEAEMSAKLGRDIKITTQDVLDSVTNPFASISNLSKFLVAKLEEETSP